MRPGDYTRTILLEAPWREFGLPPRCRVLDVGSQFGWEVDALRAMGLNAVGLDIDPKARGLVRGDALALPFRDGSFDGIVCIRTLGAIDDDAGALREFHRVLQPEGFLLAAVANLWSYTAVVPRSSINKSLRETYGGTWRLYDRPMLRAKLASAGFETVGIRGCHFLPHWFVERETPVITEVFATADQSLGDNVLLGRLGTLILACGKRGGRGSHAATRNRTPATIERGQQRRK